MKTMLMVLVLNSSGLITGWWVPTPSEEECNVLKSAYNMVQRPSAFKEQPRTIIVAECIEPFGMKGWERK